MAAPSPVFIVGGSRTGSEMLKTMLSISPELDFVDEIFLLCPWWLHSDLDRNIRQHVGDLAEVGALDRLMNLMYSGIPHGWLWTAIDQEVDRDLLFAELAKTELSLRAIFDALMRVHAKTRGKFKHNRVDFLFDSLYAGGIGGSAVALFFLAVDSVDGHPFFTPALLGHVLVLGESAQSVVNPEMSKVVYIVPLHFGWSLAMGFIVTWLIHNVELRSRHPVEVLLVIFVVFEVSLLLVVPVLAPGLIERLGIVRMLLANLLAAASMSAFFVWSHDLVPGARIASPRSERDEPEAT